jgi:peptidyl-dipeptidase Dcp
MTTLSACRDKAASDNPFFAEWGTPYGMPPFEKIAPEHYIPAIEEGIKQHTAEIEAIVNSTETPGFENVILAYDNSGAMLDKVTSVFGMVNGADSNEGLREVERQMTPLLTAHYDNVSLNPALFAKVKAVYDLRAELGLDELQLRLLEKQYKGFVRSGALLDDGRKETLRRINNEMSAADVKFRSNLLAATNRFEMVVEGDSLGGVPNDVRNGAGELAKTRGHEGKFVFTLDSRIPVLTYADNREVRRQMYLGYTERCNQDDSLDNKAVVNDLVRLRVERAQLLGYETYADFALELRMAKTPEAVYALLDDLWTPALEGAKREVEEMRAIKVRETGDPDFQAWDWWYYAEKVRKEKYNLEEEALRPYFSLPQVQSGIFELANRLYGITFEPVVVPVYNPECITVKAIDTDGTHLGILLLDMHPRAGKRVGAWCGAYRGREFNAAGEKTFDPIIYISCNFTRPVGSAPALLTLEETETFFHEFGHAIHQLFNMSPYQGLDATERDFVELPSQIMENWAFEPEMLQKYAVRWDNPGEVIPDHLVQRIRNSAYFNQGFIMTEYLAASLSDMDIHNLAEYSPIDVNAYEREILNVRRGLIDQIAPRYRFPYFNHVFGGGYTAGYYSYKWAEVLDKDAFEAFVETGDLFNREVAQRFRSEVLARGGTYDGMTLYRNFRGKEPSRDYLLYASGLKERPVSEEDAPVTEEEVDDEIRQ